MIITCKTEEGLYLRLQNECIEIHLEVFDDKSDGIEAIVTVYRLSEVLLKCCGSKIGVFNEIRSSLL